MTTAYVDDAEDVVTSTVQISIPKKIRRKVGSFKRGKLVKMECYLTFDRAEESLCLIAQNMEMISKVKLTIK
jgi:hypothetical protein